MDFKSFDSNPTVNSLELLINKRKLRILQSHRSSPSSPLSSLMKSKIAAQKTNEQGCLCDSLPYPNGRGMLQQSKEFLYCTIMVVQNYIDCNRPEKKKIPLKFVLNFITK